MSLGIGDEFWTPRRSASQQPIIAAVVVVVDGVEIALRPVWKDGGDGRARWIRPRDPASYQCDGANTPASTGVVGSRRRTRRPQLPRRKSAATLGNPLPAATCLHRAASWRRTVDRGADRPRLRILQGASAGSAVRECSGEFRC
jgi:hypothetical protein